MSQKKLIIGLPVALLLGVSAIAIGVVPGVRDWIDSTAARSADSERSVPTITRRMACLSRGLFIHVVNLLESQESRRVAFSASSTKQRFPGVLLRSITAAIARCAYSFAN